MLIMEWKNSYSVGVPELDNHHRHLIDQLNRAYSACMISKQRDVFCSIIKDLADYANYHFAAEEQLMQEHSYPGLPVHHEEHVQFASKISKLLNEIPIGTDECTMDLVELTQLLMNWLSHHILEVDMQYSQLLSGTKRG